MSTSLTTADDIELLIWEVRRLFQLLATTADGALQPTGITGAERALVEFLAKEPGPISVAELARKRHVSRQHIHQTLARLRRPDWIEKLPDPNHARSIRLALSDEGRELWKQIRVVDRRVLKRLAAGADAEDVRSAADTLRQLAAQLSEETS